MKRLYVLFDQECALCQGCRQWLMRQQAFIELHFIPLQSPEIARRFPGLQEWDQMDLREKLVVVSDEGAVYQGQYAWIMCLTRCANIANGHNGWLIRHCSRLRAASAKWSQVIAY